MATHGTKPPIFIFGVPRSGTTLLRTILDSHPAIACGPETPWLGGHQPRSLMELWRFMRDDKHGYAASYGMPRELVTAAAHEFVDRLLGEYARSKGKSRWAEKTPDNALYIDFLLELFPQAACIHLVRDGLDVAMSTCVIEEHRKGISGLLERHLGLGPGVPHVDNTPFNALLKWNHWNRLIERSLTGRQHFKLSYERLVTEPEPAIRSVLEFLGEPFVPSILDYSSFPHEYPAWEWGSADVRARGKITVERVGRGKRELSALQRAALEPLLGGDSGAATPTVIGRAKLDAPNEQVSLVAGYLAGFARPVGLAADPASLRGAAWVWLNGLARVDWPRSRLIAIDAGVSPLPWIAAMLGGDVTIVSERDPDAKLTTLRDKLRLTLQWQHPADEGTPKSEAGDVVLVGGSTCTAPSVMRALKPGGLLAAFGPRPDLLSAAGWSHGVVDPAAAVLVGP